MLHNNPRTRIRRMGDLIGDGPIRPQGIMPGRLRQTLDINVRTGQRRIGTAPGGVKSFAPRRPTMRLNRFL